MRRKSKRTSIPPEAVDSLQEVDFKDPEFLAENVLIYGAVDEEMNLCVGQACEIDRTEETEGEFPPTRDFGEEVLEYAMDGTATDILTGGFTPGGVSSDLTHGHFGGGRVMGGPTGSDSFDPEAEAEPTTAVDDPTSHARGRDKPLTNNPMDTGLSERIAGENTSRLMNTAPDSSQKDRKNQ